MKIKKRINNELKTISIFDINSLLTNDLNKKEINKLQNSIATKNLSANFKFIIIVFCVVGVIIPLIL
jgi:hypothetical protein